VVVGGGGLGTPLVRRLRLPFPVLVDADRAVYRTYGLLRALWLVQKSATFVIDRSGIVRHARASFNPQESLSLRDIFATLRTLAAEGGGAADP
jgi:peroxiredoxin